MRRLPSTLALMWLAGIVAISLLVPILSHRSPLQPIAGPLLSPAIYPPLGTDSLGRDLWIRMAIGGRLSLGLAAGAACLAVATGTAIGLLAAVLGGTCDRVLVWGANMLLAIPGLLLAMLLVATMGPGVSAIVLAVGMGGAPGYARLARAVFLQVQGESFIASARALGGSRWWVAWHHLLPNAMPQLTSFAATFFAWSFAGTTTLTFLGFSGDPAMPEWGAMLNAARLDLIQAPWAAAWPALAISLTILAVHQLADSAGLRLPDKPAELTEMTEV
jgi:ABC-type dipeptide/oligopeptide/nickel transport system permease subunit